MFENLELAAFGNRIPFLTFEVIAEEADPSVGAILADASRGAITSTSSETLVGYAAYGASAGAAAMPLIDAFGLDLFDDGTVVRSSAVSAPVILSDADFGNSSDGERAARVQREQSPVRSVPAALRLSYYDPERDFQSGEARASAGDDGGSEQSSELPAVIGADAAKGIVHHRLARDWARREKVTLRLPPRLLSLEPATRVTLPLSPADWSVERCTIDGLVVVAEMRPVTGANVALSAQAGRITGGAAAVSGSMTIALFDAPSLSGETSGTPQLLLAASSPTPGWRGGAVDVAVAGRSLRFRAPARKSVLGTALDALGAGNSFLIDRLNTIEVTLIDRDQWLTSCDDEALGNGANLALIGRELIQFGDAVPTGEGQFRLGRLVRGRGGTEWAIGGHQAGEPFVLANPEQLSVLNLPAASVGAAAVATPRSGAAKTMVVGAEGLRPPPPVAVSAKIDANGALMLSWIRRSRHGWTWRDEVDVPVGEAAERYGVRVVGSAGVVEASAFDSTIVIDAATLSGAGAGAATVEVRQVGDFAASRPATLSILLP